MALLHQHEKAINTLSPLITEGNFYLAGGTAVYYYLKHRESVDLDFFTPLEIILSDYRKLFKPKAVYLLTDTTLHAEVEGVKISMFRYTYRLLRPLKKLGPIKLASLDDIACMKVNAIIGRGSRKDFTDLYFIMKKQRLSGRECLNLFREKFGDYNPLILQKALTYFDDAEGEPQLNMLKQVQWDDIKTFFKDNFVKLE